MENDRTIVPNPAELEKQFEYVNSLIERRRSSAIALVNTEAIQMYWDIGQYISLQLQSARWGTKVVSDLADYLKRQNPIFITWLSSMILIANLCLLTGLHS